MAFIGNSVQTQGFTPAIDYFSGNGSTVTFTLSRPVASVSQMIVAVANVIQNPSSAYTVSGNAITFSSAPPSGTNNIWVEYTSLITTYAAISQSPSVIGDITASGGFFAQGNFNNSFIDGTIVDYVTGNGRLTVGPADGFTIYNGGTSARTAMGTFDSNGNFTNNANGFTGMASGTTAQRPISPLNGYTRFNSTTGTWEAYNNGGWQPLNSSVVTNYQQFTTSGTWTVPAGVRFVNVLIVGGGGGGGNGGGGGGGGGVLFVPSYPVTPAASITVTVGAAGSVNANGGYSQFDGNMIAWGGGGGPVTTDVSFGNPSGPKIGASGAGSAATSTALGVPAPGSAQGSGGGWAPLVSPFPAGGGGGAGTVGGNGASGVNGSGGTGAYYKMFSAYGQSGWFGGGGGGGYGGNTLGSGGLGGGAAGAASATANTGGGGGGGGAGNTAGSGGSGTVILAWYQ